MGYARAEVLSVPYVGITQIRCRVETFILLSACLVRKLPV